MTPCNHDWLSGTNPVIQGTVWICSKCKLCTVNDGGIPVIWEPEYPSRVDWEKMEPGMSVEMKQNLEDDWELGEYDEEDFRTFHMSLPERPDLSVWVPWRGGECQVVEGDLFCAKFRSGGTKVFLVSSLNRCLENWKHRGVSGDIIAYMFIKDCPECIADMGRGG